MAVDQPFGSLVASRLLVRQHCEHEVTWSATRGVCLEKCADHHRDSALHVESTPAPEVAVDDLSAERPMAPVLVESRDHVHVALEQKRRCFTTALEAPPGSGAREHSHIARSSSGSSTMLTSRARDMRMLPGARTWWRDSR